MTAQIRVSRGKQPCSQRSVNDAQVRPGTERPSSSGAVGLVRCSNARAAQGLESTHRDRTIRRGEFCLDLKAVRVQRQGHLADMCIPPRQRVRHDRRRLSGTQVSENSDERPSRQGPDRPADQWVHGSPCHLFPTRESQESANPTSGAVRWKAPDEKGDRITDNGRQNTLSTSKSKAVVRQCQALLRGRFQRP
jgi:hypothetical protein